MLVNGASARPYVNTRMPKFGATNVAKILEELPERDSLEPAKFERIAGQKAARNAGHQLAGDKNLACVACHTWKGERATTLTAIDLTTMGERLLEDWFHHYMLSPQQLSPGTIKREPIAYGPTNGEAVILRRQYHGIGKRGIGVGYPSGINIDTPAGTLLSAGEIPQLILPLGGKTTATVHYSFKP